MAWNTGEGVKGAAGGAAAGSVAGPWGAAIGGAVGGVAGGFGLFGGGSSAPEYNNRYDLPHFDEQYDIYGRRAQAYGMRDAPQVRESGFRRGQDALVRMLQAEAAGRGAGQRVVRMQAQQAADRGSAQQLAAAQGQVGSGAMAGRNAALGSAAVQSEVGGQAAMGGLQAQLGATGQLGGVLQGARGQDLARGQANAGLLLQNRGQNDAAVLEALRQRLQASGMQQAGGMGFNQNAANYNLAMANQPSSGDRIMGFGMGAAQTRMFGGSGGGQQPYRTSDYGSTAFDPYKY